MERHFSLASAARTPQRFTRPRPIQAPSASRDHCIQSVMIQRVQKQDIKQEIQEVHQKSQPTFLENNTENAQHMVPLLEEVSPSSEPIEGSSKEDNPQEVAPVEDPTPEEGVPLQKEVSPTQEGSDPPLNDFSPTIYTQTLNQNPDPVPQPNLGPEPQQNQTPRAMFNIKNYVYGITPLSGTQGQQDSPLPEMPSPPMDLPSPPNDTPSPPNHTPSSDSPPHPLPALKELAPITASQGSIMTLDISASQNRNHTPKLVHGPPHQMPKVLKEVAQSPPNLFSTQDTNTNSSPNLLVRHSISSSTSPSPPCGQKPPPFQHESQQSIPETPFSPIPLSLGFPISQNQTNPVLSSEQPDQEQLDQEHTLNQEYIPDQDQDKNYPNMELTDQDWNEIINQQPVQLQHPQHIQLQPQQTYTDLQQQYTELQQLDTNQHPDPEAERSQEGELEVPPECPHEECKKKDNYYMKIIKNLKRKLEDSETEKTAIKKSRTDMWNFLYKKKEEYKKESEKYKQENEAFKKTNRKLSPQNNNNNNNNKSFYTPNSQSPLYRKWKNKTEKEVNKSLKRKRIHSRALVMDSDDDEYQVIEAIIQFCEDQGYPKPMSYHVQFPYGRHTNEKYVGITHGKTSIDLNYDIHCILCGKLFKVRDPADGNVSGVSPCRGVVGELVEGIVTGVKYGAVCPSHTFDNDKTMGHYERIEDII